MPKPTFLNLPEDKRARVVEAAVDEFSSKSYHEASLSSVVARAGIAKGSMYQYFEDKLDLYRWLVLEHLPAMKLASVEAAAPDPDTGLFPFLEAACAAGIRFAADHPKLMRLGAATLEPSSDPRVAALHAALREKTVAYWADAIRRAQARGEVRADVDPAVAAGFVRAVVGEGIVQALLHRLGVDLRTFLTDPTAPERLRGLDTRDLVREALGFLERGLAAPEGVRA